MKIKELTDYLEQIAPLSLQESYDNAGLLVGDAETEISGVLICLDSTEEIIREAVNTGCNLVIAHHPIIFSGLKKLNGKNYIERTVIAAIRNNIAIYAAHTNLDTIHRGVNQKISEKLGLKDTVILTPKKELLRKLVTFCPDAKAEEVRFALFAAGAGDIGNYDSCSFNVSGTGTFRGNEKSNPFAGKPGDFHREAESRIEVIYEKWKEPAILRALIQSHPYEEVAYDLFSLENAHRKTGSGMIGSLSVPLSGKDFLEMVKKSMKTTLIRHTALINSNIERVAVCGGSGSFLLPDAIKAGAQAFVTSDFKYHQFFDADNRILIADIGHFESEQFTIELFRELILKKFPTFAVRLTEVNTNPVHYI
ncbi:MAG TPA: Nif3-like dinuclear metal center hexameric protein [Bacteroidia bacterium]|nr:Nif3-like dinuclear metal center hexameric protein [Bacteroidia bacterium]